MGMDVYGINPKTKVGGATKPADIDIETATQEEIFTYYEKLDEWHHAQPGSYFRASIWSWAPIHQLICKANEHFYSKHNEYLLDPHDLREMELNVGAGPKDQNTCDIIADYIDVWMEHHTDGAWVDSSIRVKDDGTLVIGEEGDKFQSAYSVDDDHLKEWVEFLRNCGGFRVC